LRRSPHPRMRALPPLRGRLHDFWSLKRTAAVRLRS
jgi:hypothetical protein